MMKPGRILMVVILLVGLVAMLPITGVYSRESCDWRTEVKSSGSATLGGGGRVALSVKSGDLKLTEALRQGIAAGLTARGVTELVDNPMTRPRAQVVVEAMTGRWTPFWAPLSLQVRVLLENKRNDAERRDATVTVSGTCTGLVSQAAWHDGPIAAAVDGVLAQLTAGR